MSGNLEFSVEGAHSGLVLRHCAGIRIDGQLRPAADLSQERSLRPEHQLPEALRDYRNFSDPELFEFLARRAMRHIIIGDQTQPPGVLNVEIERFVARFPRKKAKPLFAVRLIPEVGRIKRVVFDPGVVIDDMSDHDYMLGPNSITFDLNHGKLRLEIYQDPQKPGDLPPLQAATVNPKCVQRISS